ncbi:phage gp6-like head-tail connector protein [Clostridium sp. K12(2020)]|uniref:head-tail connector protein n=1 Tax=unclassified Clostridium TaxID=2614128 RepID=UPI001C8CBC3E|nr:MULTISPECIES: head-tail connector protein [unclassified Clostridium]MBX9139239.1 phage gp6-like head-tail connector protein [Clostridium sp. K12(2020)]MBX9145994.1 phage gp6-like head-tail connector protein [Clostridium sp. K13]UWG26039.1 MAG: head-tail connector protein [Bacteriophage sp.]
MILTLEEAKAKLRVDFEEDDELISGFIESIPDYLETKTGSRWEEEPINPLVKILAGYLICSMYDNNFEHYEKPINNLLMVLSSMARTENE